MGKRKNNTFELRTPKKEKRPASDSSDSEQEDEEEQNGIETEVEESKVEDSKELTYEPDEFRVLAESFHEFVNFKQANKNVVRQIEKLITEWANDRDEMIDPSLFYADYRKYLQKATRQKNFQLGDCAHAILSFVGGEKSLSEFKSLPEKPPQRLQMYNKIKNIHIGGVSAAHMKKAHKTMAEDPEGVEEADKMIREYTRQYIPRLKEFIDKHPNLTEEQTNAIKRQMKLAGKKTEVKEPSQKTPKKRVIKKEAETPFSLFCRTKNEKYRDLSDEEREQKLRKKFEKLPKEMRDLFESLALNI
uniref:HMG box domain-containing protein n=1 Tax=Caenorhabditis tropicalis TaxID=1561998 RepID=A0A1I7TYW6_9PELO